MLTGWTKSIPIKLYSIINFTDYQVKFVIHRTNGTSTADDIYVGTDCLENYNDIRFTSTTDTIYPYWIESSDASSATIWVKIPSIIANAYTELVLQYKNTDAISELSDDHTTTDNYPYKFYPQPLTNWNYKKLCDIKSNTTLTDYQIKLRIYRSNNTDYISYSSDTIYNIYVGSKCLENYNDIIFVSNTGDTLSHWIQTSTSLYADIWVKLPEINTTSYIWIYYGNDTASSYSCGDATFDFFDDFNKPTIDTIKWSGATEFASISNNKLYYDTGSFATDFVYLTTNTDNNYIWNANFEVHVTMEFLNVANTSATHTTKIGFFNDTNTQYVYLSPEYISGYDYPVLKLKSSNPIIDYTIYNGAFNQIQQIYGCGCKQNKYFAKIDDVYRSYYSNLPTGILNLNLPFSFAHLSSGGTGYGFTCDTIFIHKHATTEPDIILSNVEISLKDTLVGWKYRQFHQLSGDILDYQIKFNINKGNGTSAGNTIYCNNKCKSDFGDIRFTDTHKIELPYWIESYTPDDMATVWVRVSDTNSKIWVYYGNENATTTSSGESTFIFFEGFDAATYDTTKWEYYPPASGGTISFANSIYTQTISNGCIGGLITKPYISTDASNVITSCKLKITTCTGTMFSGLGIKSYGMQNGAKLVTHYNTSGPTFKIEALDGYNNYNGTSIQTPVLNTWYIFDIRYDTPTFYYRCDESPTWNTWNISTAYENYNCNISLSCYIGGGTVTTQYDYVYQRKYAITEPTHGIWSTEEEIISLYPLGANISPTTGEFPLTVNIETFIEDALTDFNLVYGTGDIYKGNQYTTKNKIIYNHNVPHNSFANTTVSYRIKFLQFSILSPTSHIKIYISSYDKPYTILHASIVEATALNSQNGITTPTQITFNNGGNGVDITTTNGAVSDLLMYTIKPNTPYIIIFDIQTPVGTTRVPGTYIENDNFSYESETMYKSGVESWNLQNTTFSNGAFGVSILNSIELYSNTESYLPQISYSNTYTYNTPGVYTIFLSGIDGNQHYKYYELPYKIQVTAPTIVASFTISQSYNTITFTNTSTGNINECYWTFGDGSHSYETNPTHTYSEVGTYEVTLYSSNQYQYDEYTTEITIDTITFQHAPIPNFKPAYLNIITDVLPYTVQFTDLSTPQTDCTYYWNFGDLSTSTEKNPSHDFASLGTYDVSLTVTNDYGSSTITYEDCIRIHNEAKIFKENLTYDDTFATFGIMVFTEFASYNDMFVKAKVFVDFATYTQGEFPSTPGIDEYCNLSFYENINDYCELIYTEVSDYLKQTLLYPVMSALGFQKQKMKKFTENVYYDDTFERNT